MQNESASELDGHFVFWGYERTTDRSFPLQVPRGSSCWDSCCHGRFDILRTPKGILQEDPLSPVGEQST